MSHKMELVQNDALAYSSARSHLLKLQQVLQHPQTYMTTCNFPHLLYLPRMYQ
uniref:Uncharacterized protein n=1 Tax=Arundo donax TaxID=35708 RepID=A0A0A9EXR6_ARUDO